MSKNKKEFFLVIVILVVIAALSYIAINKNNSISTRSQTATSTAPLSTYIDQKYGIKIDYPYFLTATTTFASSYLLPDNWNIYGQENAGDEIVDIQYPTSNEILSSEVRVGASTIPSSVASCLKFDSGFATSTRTINGVKFVYSAGSDAAMSHFSTTKSYRTLHGGACIAIDEVTYGTNPEVYDPPRTVPFDKVLAEAIFDNVVASITFIK